MGGLLMTNPSRRCRQFRQVAIICLGVASGACADPARPATASVTRIEVLVAGRTTTVALLPGIDASAEVRALDADGRVIGTADASLSVSDPTRLKLELSSPSHGPVEFLQRDRAVWVLGTVRDGGRTFRDSTLVTPASISSIARQLHPLEERCATTRAC